jgi:hypothetical protein
MKWLNLKSSLGEVTQNTCQSIVQAENKKEALKLGREYSQEFLGGRFLLVSQALGFTKQVRYC